MLNIDSRSPSVPLSEERITALLDLLDRADAWTREHLARFRTESARLHAELRERDRGMNQILGELATLQEKLNLRESQLLSELATLQEKLNLRENQFLRELAILQEKLDLRESNIRSLEGSLCWRITKPLRVLHSYVRR
jgi:predicted nuclease with TOPRIM domain